MTLPTDFSFLKTPRDGDEEEEDTARSSSNSSDNEDGASNKYNNHDHSNSRDYKQGQQHYHNRGSSFSNHIEYTNSEDLYQTAHSKDYNIYLKQNNHHQQQQHSNDIDSKYNESYYEEDGDGYDRTGSSRRSCSSRINMTIPSELFY